MCATPKPNMKTNTLQVEKEKMSRAAKLTSALVAFVLAFASHFAWLNFKGIEKLNIFENVQKLQSLRAELAQSVAAKNWRRAEGIMTQIWLLGGVIIGSVIIAIVVYSFIAIGTGLGFGLSADQKGNISSIGNTGAQTLNFLPLLALAVIVSVVLGVLLSMFMRNRS